MKKIIHIQVLPKHQLSLTFSDQKTVQIDFSDKIVTNTVTEPLSDLDFFQKVQITQGGRVIEWPGEIDFCADALWLEGSQEKNSYLIAPRVF